MANTGGENYVVPYLGQGSVFGEDECAAVRRLLMSDAHLGGGAERERFEDEFAALVGAEHALAVTSCTAALELATKLINLRDGDQVVVAPITYQATAAPLLGRRLDVKFCDVDANTLCMDPRALREIVTEKTRAIYVTHYGGLMAQMDRIMEIADECGAVVIEDCAHALGASDHGRPPGTCGHIGCWSFQSLKNISTLGQGGMLTLHDAGWAATADRLRSVEPDADFAQRPSIARFGAHPAPTAGTPIGHEKNAFTHDCVTVRSTGTNAAMSEPAAAVGRVQLTRLPELIERRAAVARALDGGLNTVPGVRLQCEPTGQRHAHHLYSLFLEGHDGVARNEVAQQIEAAGVEIVLRYFPLHLLPEWRLRGGRYGLCPVAERIWFEQLLNLPIYPRLSEGQISHVIESVATAVATVTEARQHDKKVMKRNVVA
jgi:perosamine synthetase